MNDKQRTALRRDHIGVVFQSPNLLGSLTAREQDVVKLAAMDMSNKDIGEKLFISLPTVKMHRSSAFTKLGVKSALEAYWMLETIGVVGSILSSVNSGLGSLVNFVLGVGWMVYLGYKSGTTGVTFGRSIAKTKLISEETGQPIGSTNGIIRQFAHIVDSVICYIGWLFPLWDAKRQTIADKIMKTVVVDNSTDPNAGNYNWNL